MKTKAIYLNGEYFLFPQGVTSAREFAGFLGANFNRFILLTKLDDDVKQFPYFLEGRKKEVYVNVHAIKQFEEVEIEIVPDAKSGENGQTGE